MGTSTESSPIDGRYPYEAVEIYLDENLRAFRRSLLFVAMGRIVIALLVTAFVVGYLAAESSTYVYVVVPVCLLYAVVELAYVRAEIRRIAYFVDPRREHW
ncbi:MAG TPA: hypothetical protein VNA69_05605 [Thermoanaerobaculia bacterium]|nr:hypothetical protein [Thermoanaerobaculia bacterium]